MANFDQSGPVPDAPAKRQKRRVHRRAAAGYGAEGRLARGVLGAACLALAIGAALPGQGRAASPALPTGGQYVAGQGQIGAPAFNGMTINQSSARGIINWQSFSIGSGGTVQINNGSGATLNRVTGNNLSQLDGQLSSTGSTYLINQHGVVVGPGGKVLTGGSFVASTRDIANSQFMAGGTLTAQGNSAGTVVNSGKIISKNGDVVLIGQSVSNTGAISAGNGTAALAAGNTVVMAPANGPAGIYVAPGSSGDVSNSGTIKAAAAALESAGGNVYSLAGNRTGLIRATGTATVNGQVWLTAPQGKVVVSGALAARNADGSGGTVVVNGSAVTVTGSARINASGTRGGTVLIGVSAPGGVDEANSTTIATGARITAAGAAKGTLNGGHIETSGKVLSVQAATVSAGEGGSWLLDPTDLTIDATAATTITTSLNAGTSVTLQTTATSASGPGNQTPGLGDINIDSAIDWTNAAANLSVLAYHAINVNAAITGAGSVLMSAAGSDLTIASGASITGDAGVTLGTAGNFINNGGANAVSAGAAKWLIYSTNPAADADGGLAPNFIQYNAGVFPESGTGASAPAGTGNGFLYSVAPQLTLSLIGPITKTYDGTTAVTIAPANFTAAGVINGDTIVLAGSYGTPNAGSSIRVTVTSVTAYNGSPAVPVYGYTVTNPTNGANIGTIMPAPLTVSIVGNPTKTYNGTTTATLTSPDFSVAGLVAGQSVTVAQADSAAYASASAGPQPITAVLSSSDFVAASGTLLSNYAFPVTATGPGTILQAPIIVTGVLANDKTYDGTTADVLDTSGAGIYGVIGSDSVSLVTSGATGNFASPNVGTNLPVTGSGFTLSGADAANYQIVEPTNLTADITPATLTISGLTATDKVYDGTTTDSLSGTPVLTGVVAGDDVSLSGGATGTFASPNAGTGIAVTVTGLTLSGTSAGNYTVTAPAPLTANITPAPVTVTITGNPTKTYDGNAVPYLTASNYEISGFVAGQGATLPQVSDAEYASANAGTWDITATLSPSDFSANAGTLLSNYALPASAVGPGTITQAVLRIGIIGNPTKVYDGTNTATLAPANYSILGLVIGESVTITQTTGAYATPNVGYQAVAANLSASDFSTGPGTDLSNYVLPAVVSGLGTIVQRAISPGQIAAAIVNNPTKVYDGTTTIALASSNFALTGFVAGQGATVAPTTGTFETPNAGVQEISVSLSPSDFIANDGTDLSNYILPTAAYGPGTITPAPVTLSIINNPTKIYNGTTNATLTPDQISVSGFVAGQGVQILVAKGSYASADAGSQEITADLSQFVFTLLPGTELSNYSVQTAATGQGTITPAPLTVTGVLATSKVYDTTANDPLITSRAALNGLVSGDSVTLSSVSGTGTFTQVNVGNGITVNTSGFSISGPDAGNYILLQPSGLTANIIPALLTVANVTATNRIYNGTTTDALATGSATLSGVLGSDAVTLSSASATGTFRSANVGNNLAVRASGFTISGAQAGNYVLAQPTGLTASITPAPITITITGDPTKVYNGTTSIAIVSGSEYTLTGFAPGEGATVTQTSSASFASPNAGTQTVTATLVASDFSVDPGTNPSNYTLAGPVTGIGTITPAPLAVEIIGDPTKTYDGTTTAALTQANYLLVGFVGSESATITQTVGTYASANAGEEPVSATLAAGNFTPGSGTLLSNYTLPVTASGEGTITQAGLTITGVVANNKVYDNTTAASLSGTPVLNGLVTGDDVTVSANATTGTFAQADVGNGIAVTATPGDYVISGADAANYFLLQPTGLAANITPATLTVTNVTKVYDSKTSLPTASTAYTLSGIFAGDSVALVTSAVTGSYASKNVATGIAVTATGLTLTGAQAFDYILAPVNGTAIGTITPALLTITGVTANNKVYDGTTAATLSGTPVLNGVFTGDTVTISAAPTPTGTFAQKDVANNIPVTATPGDYTLGGADAGNYTIAGQPTGLTANITPNGTALTLTAVTKVYDGTTSPPTGNTQYTLSGIIGGDQVFINAALVTGAYADPNVGTGIDVTLGGLALTGAEAIDYTIAPTVTADPIGTITPRPITVSIINNPTKTYDATTAATLTSTNYSLSGFVAGQGATITQTAGTYASANAGPEQVTANITGFYTLTGGAVVSNYILPATATGPGTILQAALTITGVTANNKVYDQTTSGTLNTSNAALAGVVSGSTVSLVSTSAIGTFADPNVANGIAVTASGFTIAGADAGNYTLAQPTGLFANITPATITITNVTKQYDSTTNLPTASAAYVFTGVYAGDTVNLDASGVTGAYGAKNVGTGIAVTASGLALTGAQAFDYQIAAINGTAIGTITPAPLTITGITANNKTYDGTTAATLSGTPALSGVFSGDVVNVSAVTTTGTFAQSNVGNGIVVTATPGDYAISGTDAGNYTLSQPTGLSANITPATLTYVATPASRTYGATNPALTGTVTGFVNGETQASVTTGTLTFTTAVTATTNVGSYAIAGSGLTANNGNYIFVQAATNATAFTITPATLTYVADPVSQRYGTPIPALAGSVTGFVNGDTIASATAGTLTFTTTAQQTSNVGTYAISGSGLTANNGNYVFVQAPANATAFTITPSILFYVAEPVVRSYGAANPPLTGIVVGFVNGDTLADATTGTLTFTTAATVTSNVGSYAITGSGLTANNGNYVFAQAPTNTFALGVTPAALVYTATPASRVYGAANPPLTGTVTGFVNGQTQATATTGTLTFTTPATVTSNVGRYSITGAGLTANNGNYIFVQAFINRIAFTITPATLTYVANPVSQTYGTPIPTLTGTVTGFVNGDTIGNATTGTLGFSTTATVTSNIGSYAITGSGLTANNGNYTFVQAAANATAFTITPATLTASLTGTVAKTYDGTDAATLSPANYVLSGIKNGDAVTLNDPTAGTYAQSNAGTGIAVTVNGLALGGASGNYVLAASTISGNVGTINPALLSVSITGNPAKVYDGTTTATLTPPDYTLTGFISGQGAEVTQTVGAYASPNAGVQTVTANLTPADYAADAGTNLANYILPATASGPGTILQAPLLLAVVIVDDPSKVYDGTDVATLTPQDFALSGFLPGEGATITQTVGRYASADAGVHLVTAMLTPGDYDPNDLTNLANYILPTIAVGPGTIGPAVLTASIIGNPTKTYDTTTGATLGSANYMLSGFVAGQGGTVTQTVGTYASANAGMEFITADLDGSYIIANAGTNLANYILPASAAGPGTIDPAPLTVTGIYALDKFYDGNTKAKLNTDDAALQGILDDDIVLLSTSGATGRFASAGPGNDIPVSVLGLGLYGADAGNYFLIDPTGLTANITPGFTSFQASVYPVLNIPFPELSGVLTRGGAIFGSLPTIVSGTLPTTASAQEKFITTGQTFIVNTEEILLQGNQNKQWRIVLPANPPASISSFN
jgi:filamentous hemagglutinin family protein